MARITVRLGCRAWRRRCEKGWGKPRISAAMAAAHMGAVASPRLPWAVLV